MGQIRTYAALDVHMSKVAAVTVDSETGELRHKRLPGDTRRVANYVAKQPGPVLATYEAGPTGYGLARALADRDVTCLVAAPGKIPRSAQDRIKTDRRDAEKLVRLLMAGELKPVRVPTTREEALRDLVRAREDIRGDLMRNRHRLGKMLLRHDIHYTETKSRWGERHRRWLGQVKLSDPAAQAAYLDYLGAIDGLVVRRDTVEQTLGGLVPDSPWADTVARFRCLRGINTLTAVGLCAEVGDFARFEKPKQLMGYLGLVPSEQSSGDKRRQGSITKSGSRHARRLLVEAAWHNRWQPRTGEDLAKRQVGQPDVVIAIAWNAQRRLFNTWRRLDRRRGKRRTVVAVAAARELAGFCWAVANA